MKDNGLYVGKETGLGTCGGCEFCFPHKDGFVCADVHYGKNVTKELSEIKSCYSEGLDDFIKRQKDKSNVDRM